MKKAYKVTFVGPAEIASGSQPRYERLVLGVSFSDIEMTVAELQKTGEIDPTLELVGIYISRKFAVRP